jgi:hypothetical protein
MRRPKQVIYAMQEIEQIFKKDRRLHIPAREFLSRIEVNKRTLLKARDTLKIKSERLFDKGSKRWIIQWTRSGFNNLEPAIAQLNEQHKSRRNHVTPTAEKLCIELMEEMFNAHNASYEMPAVEMMTELCNAYSASIVSRAKRRLGVMSARREGRWYWLYPAEELVLWIENQLLGQAPVPEQDIYDAAQREKGWSKNLVDFARRRAGADIVRMYRRNIWCWVSVRDGAPREEW